MLTPPLVSTRVAATPPRRRSRLDDLGSSSAAMPRSTASKPSRRSQGQQGAPVGVADLTRVQRTAALDQLVTGRQHPDPEPARTRHLLPADAGQHAEVPRAEHGPGGEDLLAGGDVVTGRPHVHRRRSPAAGSSTPSRPSLRVFSTMATASAPAGKGAPGHDPERLARARPRCRAPRPRPGSPITVQPHRVVGAGAGRIGGPHRVAVHRRVGERRHVGRRRRPPRPARSPTASSSSERAAMAGAAQPARTRGSGLVERDHDQAFPPGQLGQVLAERRARDPRRSRASSTVARR